MSAQKVIWGKIGTVFSILLFTKVIGFIKQIIIAGYYGADFHTDIYNIAYGFVNSSGFAFFSALTVTFLTVFNKRKADHGEKKASIFVSNVFVVFGIISIFLCIVFCLFGRQIGSVISNGYSESELNILGEYISTLSIIIVFYGINTIFNAVLEANMDFKLSRSSGLVTSTVLIIFTVFGYKALGIYALIYGSITAYILQTVMLLVYSRRYFKMSMPGKIFDADMWRLLRLIVPLLLGNGIYEINKLTDRYIASGLPVGTATSLSYAQVLFDTFGALFITSICAVLFSFLSKLLSEGKGDDVSGHVMDVSSILMLVVFPISIALVILSEDIVMALFQHGNYSYDAARQSAYILCGYSVGMPFLALREVLLKTHYAYQDSRSPMINSITAVILNLIVSLNLSKLIGALGISVGTAVSYTVCAFLSSFTIKRHNRELKIRYLFPRIYKTLIAGVVMGMETFVLHSALDGMNVYFRLAMEISAACLLYVAVLYLLRCKELQIAVNWVKRELKERIKKHERTGY